MVTEKKGPLAGRRVVRGHEKRCAAIYRNQPVRKAVRSWAYAQAKALGEESERNLVRELRGQIEALHQVFQDWFNGALDHSEASFLPIQEALATDFTMITPKAEVVRRRELMSRLKKGHGTRAGQLRIWIDDVELLHERDDIAIVSYIEWQRMGDEEDRGRRSSVWFQQRPDGSGWLWRHVHETSLPT